MRTAPISWTLAVSVNSRCKVMCDVWRALRSISWLEDLLSTKIFWRLQSAMVRARALARMRNDLYMSGGQCWKGFYRHTETFAHAEGTQQNIVYGRSICYAVPFICFRFYRSFSILFVGYLLKEMELIFIDFYWKMIGWIEFTCLDKIIYLCNFKGNRLLWVAIRLIIKNGITKYIIWSYQNILAVEYFFFFYYLEKQQL